MSKSNPSLEKVLAALDIKMTILPETTPEWVAMIECVAADAAVLKIKELISGAADAR